MSDTKSAPFIKIVELPATRVVSFHVPNSTTPEAEAYGMLEAWGKSRGILDQPALHQVFGFNHPYGPMGEPRGYELWVTIPDGYDPGDNVEVKHFAGGKYAMATLLGVNNIGPVVQMLHDWVAASDQYESGYPPEFNVDVDPMPDLEQVVSPLEISPEQYRLDYYVPIRDKQ
jgi:DNA gyrase inhibitor GyrI